MRYSFDEAEAPTTNVTQFYEMLGTRGLWHDGWKVVAEHGPLPVGRGRFDEDRWQLFHTEYKPTFELTGATITKVVFDVGDDAYIDLERHLAAAMSRA